MGKINANREQLRGAVQRSVHTNYNDKLMSDYWVYLQELTDQHRYCFFPLRFICLIENKLQEEEKPNLERLSLAAFDLSSGDGGLEAVITMPEAALLGRQRKSGRREECGGGVGDLSDLRVHLKTKKN